MSTNAATKPRKRNLSKVEKPEDKSAKEKAESLMNIEPIKPKEKPAPTVEKEQEGTRYFLVDFTISYKTPKGDNGIMQDTAKIGKMVNDYPNKNLIVKQIPMVYGITEEQGFTNINVYNIRPWWLNKQDFDAFTREA